MRKGQKEEEGCLPSSSAETTELLGTCPSHTGLPRSSSLRNQAFEERRAAEVHVTATDRTSGRELQVCVVLYFLVYLWF